jgi:hypothetical protein
VSAGIEAELAAFVLAEEGTLKHALADYVKQWRARAGEARKAWLAGEADPAVAAAQDAETAMSHEQYRLNAVACDRHAERAAAVLTDLSRLINRYAAAGDRGAIAKRAAARLNAELAANASALSDALSAPLPEEKSSGKA